MTSKECHNYDIRRLPTSRQTSLPRKIKALDGSIAEWLEVDRKYNYRSVLLGMVAASSVGPSEDISKSVVTLTMCTGVCKLLVLNFFSWFLISTLEMCPCFKVTH